MLVPLLALLQSLAPEEDCPRAIDVEQRVRTILHLAPERQLSEAFLVERHEAGLYVVLKSADNAVIGERTLEAQGSCDELAQAAAVVLSVWLTDVHPDFASELPAPEPAAAPVAPALAASSTPTPAVAPAPQAAPAPAPRAPPGPRRAGFDLALGAGLELSSAGFLPAGVASIGYGAYVRGWGVAALGRLTLEHDQELGPGSVTWRRWPVGLGPTYRFTLPEFRFDVSAGPALGWLRFEGKSFDRTSSQTGVSWGGFLNARVSGRSRPVAPFLLTEMQIYPFESTAYVDNLDSELPLPAASFVLALGVVFAP